MKTLPSRACLALLACLSSCTRAAVSGGGTRFDVRCELVTLEATTEAHATARFRATNLGDVAFSYSGHSPEGPLYACEVLEGGVWQPSPLGWCGTGLSEHALRPGASIEFDTIVPCNGKSYRFALGEPRLLTPDVSCAPPSGSEPFPADTRVR
jgi:hypothetical protein